MDFCNDKNTDFFPLQNTFPSEHYVTRIILRPLSALSLDEVNIAKRNITTGLFGLNITQIVFNLKYSPPLMTKNSCRKLFKQEVMGGIPLTSLTPPHFLSDPNQNRSHQSQSLL
jgi:hypothetical protein